MTKAQKKKRMRSIIALAIVAIMAAVAIIPTIAMLLG